MIRLAWRQFRSEATVALVGLAAVALVLGITGPTLVHEFDTARSQLAHTDYPLQVAVATLLLVVPVLLGVFFGAPLVARELESGTFRLIWTQSVSRSKWLVVKFAVVGLAATVVAGGFDLMAAWWADPINIADHNRFGPAAFGIFGVVPFGYGLFAFALGATAGLLLRRTLPAMLATIVGYVVARIAVTYWVRPHFASPLRRSLSLLQPGSYNFSRGPSGLLTMTAFPPNIPNGWGLSASIVDRAGHGPTSRELARLCPALLATGGRSSPSAGGLHTHAAPGGGMQACITHLASRFHEVVTYQPASRYWPFQLAETALFAVAAVALCAFSVWWARRRLV